MKKRRYGLVLKFVLGILIIGICITAVSVSVGVWNYKNSVTKNYNNMAYDIAETAAGYFTEEELKTYAELTYRYNTGNASKDEIKQVTESERYQSIQNSLDKLRSSMEANDIYVCVFDADVLNNYTQESFENGEWNPLYYITDSYQIEEKRMYFGDTSPIEPSYRKVISDSYYSGARADDYFVSKGQFGYNTSAAYPVVQDGKTVAFVGVEIPMQTLQSDLTNYIVRVILLAGFTAILLLIVGITFLVKTMLNPIKLISAEAAQFVENNNEISKDLEKIHTNDEIQVLGESLLKMEIGINEYIENLQKVTAEKERIGAELNVATQIQEDMLPRIFPAFPERPEMELYASMTAAKEVGGDFYDYFLIDDDHLCIVIGDVSGKGVPAALFMVISKTIIKNYAMAKLSVNEIFTRANEELCQGNEAELFTTAWIGIYEISSGVLKFADAGHDSPLIRRNDGTLESVKPKKKRLMLAGMEGIRYVESETRLEQGELILLYTDGVPEACNAAEEFYGMQRLEAVMNRERQADPTELLTAIKKDVDQFVGEADPFDDLTMLALEINRM